MIVYSNVWYHNVYYLTYKISETQTVSCQNSCQKDFMTYLNLMLVYILISFYRDFELVVKPPVCKMNYKPK